MAGQAAYFQFGWIMRAPAAPPVLIPGSPAAIIAAATFGTAVIAAVIFAAAVFGGAFSPARMRPANKRRGIFGGGDFFDRCLSGRPNVAVRGPLAGLGAPVGKPSAGRFVIALAAYVSASVPRSAARPRGLGKSLPGTGARDFPALLSDSSGGRPRAYADPEPAAEKCRPKRSIMFGLNFSRPGSEKSPDKNDCRGPAQNYRGRPRA
jgi:hypothetical protein